MDKKTRDLIKEETLCSNNLQVKFYLTQLKKKLKGFGITDNETFELISDSLETLRVMKKQGQKMEDRLTKYFQAITSLSFIRVRKGKKKSWGKNNFQFIEEREKEN